ncbi:hypothetical protein SAMN05421833_122106 [Microbispora rosea]|uniref:Uncharacterized protein n=1 Tax=Microbispora rosea TaxID=58117 RepID=A0A1N7FK93_9ACTN|nr:hypothetical protein [Microbispora rosea]GIH50341.1 hypothetical protein Mro03_55200 [Microbispora rosea subsp. rosea]SIS00656.1 hypothetical protein SAMN05421833_122106 [Microbispora rosea]
MILDRFPPRFLDESARHYRWGVPALIAAAAYGAVIVVAAAVATARGDIGVLWRLTLFFEADEDATARELANVDVTAVWPNVLVLLAAGGLWGWALWQGLRGPVAGRPPATDRGVLRLRVAFYAAAGSWLVSAVAPAWPWWAVVIDSLVMSAVVVLFHPVLRRAVGFPGLALAAGLLTNTSVAAVEVFDVLGWREARRVADMPDISALASLIWTALVFLTQWRDGRWRRATVWYGIASLVVPVALLPLAVLEIAGISGDVYGCAITATNALTVIWLARSAHEVTDPPVPSGRPVLPPARASG